MSRSNKLSRSTLVAVAVTMLVNAAVGMAQVPARSVGVTDFGAQPDTAAPVTEAIPIFRDFSVHDVICDA